MPWSKMNERPDDFPMQPVFWSYLLAFLLIGLMGDPEFGLLFGIPCALLYLVMRWVWKKANARTSFKRVLLALITVGAPWIYLFTWRYLSRL